MTRSPSSTSAAASASALVAGAPVGVRVYGVKRKGGDAPLVIHFHGGAFISGNLDSGEPMSTLLAEAGAVVVSVDYPLAPAHPFPQAVEAGYSVLEWAFRNRVKLAGPAPRIFLAGEEAGGNIAAAIALVARDRAHPPLAGQILVTPMLDPCVATASQREAMGPQTECIWSQGWQQYLQKPMDAEHPYAVPGQVQRLAGLPATLVMAGSDDPMRDEAQRYAQRLQAGGIAARFLMLEGRTGWPASLTEEAVASEPCACADSVRAHLSQFLDPEVRPASPRC